MNLRQRFQQALIDQGFATPTNEKFSVRYDVLARTKGGFYYLGRNGSLRYGLTVTLSRPVSNKFKARLLAPAIATYTNIGLDKSDDGSTS